LSTTDNHHNYKIGEEILTEKKAERVVRFLLADLGAVVGEDGIVRFQVVLKMKIKLLKMLGIWFKIAIFKVGTLKIGTIEDAVLQVIIRKAIAVSHTALVL